MRILAEQIEAQRRAQSDRLVRDLQRHFRERLPTFAAHYPAALDEAVALSAARAGAYGVHGERDLCRYFTVVGWLGSYFDVDPQYPWAHALLTHPQRSPTERVAEVLDRATRFADNVYGDGTALIVAVEEGMRALTASEPQTPASLLALAKRVHPTRVAWVGEATLSSVFGHALSSASAAGLGSPLGELVHAGLTFFLGSAYLSDPLFPWTRSASGEPDGRAQQLARSAGECFALLVGGHV